MPIYGMIKRDGLCPLCKEVFHTGDTVYHDSTKSPKSSVVHSLCFEKTTQKAR